MSAVRNAANVLGTISAISVRDAGNVLKTVTIGKVRDAGAALKTFFSALSATASPESKNAFGNSSSAVDVTVDLFTATPSGGVAPFTYLWTETTAGVNTWAITNPTGPSTGFTCEALGQFDSDTAGFTCTITDSTGATADTNEVTAHATNLGGGG